MSHDRLMGNISMKHLKTSQLDLYVASEWYILTLS